MASIFISGIPKARPLPAVEAFLTSEYPTATSVKILRDHQKDMHKGHAYVHFANHEAVLSAVTAYCTSQPDNSSCTNLALKDLLWDGTRLHQRVVASADATLAPTSSDATTCTSTCLLSPAAPLPPAYIAYPHARYTLHRGLNKETVVPVESSGSATAVCAGPRLLDLMTDRTLSPSRSSDDDFTVEGLRNRGLQFLTPAEALSALRDYVSGSGGIAVRDKHGFTAMLRVPTYAAGYTHAGVPSAGSAEENV